MAKQTRKSEALAFHAMHPPGKIEVTPTKPMSSQHDLALAYSPGVAEPCLEIAANKEEVYKYTAKGNLVAVISNGTAVLGLGNIGPEASKPVMEGKGVLFKKFAGIDVFDIEVNENDPDEFIKIVRSLEPTFGGVNLEDIKAPESFKIEKELRETMQIPIMHDDQHGTAIISSAALLNALEVVNKKIDEITIVVNGAGAAAIACTDLYVQLGVKPTNIIMVDSKGVVRKDRENLDPSKAKYATHKNINELKEAIVDADMFLGLSIANVLTPEMLKLMSKNPIVFALANPDPEIAYPLAIASRNDVVLATGRSDYPNQVNNVLGFPYIFRGALDVRATQINDAMKLAAVKALADMAKLPVPDMVAKAYGVKSIKFGRDYLIPKPLDPRLITQISPAVAKAAIDSGVAKIKIDNWSAYQESLLKRIGIDQRWISRIINRARKDPKRIVFVDGEDPKVILTAQMLMDDGVAHPILLGNRKNIERIAVENEVLPHTLISLDYTENQVLFETFSQSLFDKRSRKGMTLNTARVMMQDKNYFAAMMVEHGMADAMIAGLANDYPKTILPALHVIGVEKNVNRVAGMYIMNTKKGIFFFADTTVNENPDADELVDIIGLAARAVRFFDAEPIIAALSYSNFGSVKGKLPNKVAEAVQKAKTKWPDLIIDGDIQANVALNPKILEQEFSFSSLNGKQVNTFIFPDLASGNIAYKLLMEIGGAEATGPILMGMKKAVHVLQFGASVREIYNMSAIAVVDAQNSELN